MLKIDRLHDGILAELWNGRAALPAEARLQQYRYGSIAEYILVNTVKLQNKHILAWLLTLGNLAVFGGASTISLGNSSANA